MTNNAGLSVDQKVTTRDKHHTIDKVIRHEMLTISSADGHYQQRNLKEQWEKSRERAIISMILTFAHHEIRNTTVYEYPKFTRK